ncbi:hypothetical protein HMPREF9318_00646 [Streptococcus urinalis FB127-CNA-2]|uniref:Tetratricopeptide repeat protein n=1 Tax=Streptococcus urinalis 2285-97 TaxID=764291 RepID=G5KH08_9STRE|nr:tetratricopeptide repeat protein [Streptococcus urinalis]EHJ55607.1 tetratricopeptide repeat protein [Streptococcus urinalis 2285-97]EKS22448.1 hypothetical protein HMPREF9318_00646 [Streptococcus urinalis FB127-CNA-2]VEF32261.1 TPR repeat-containing protein [Streptococcus urinalis]
MLNSEKMITSIDNQDLEHAEKYFLKALKNDPDDVLLSLAQYLEGIGFLDHAKKIYLSKKELFPDVNINLAQIAAEDGNIEEAFLYLDQIAPDDDSYLSALLVMADLYDLEGLTDVAREKLILASQLSQDPIVIFGLAEIELSLGHFDEAIKEYAKLDNREILAQTGISTYQRIGRAYAALGKFEVAIEFLEKSLTISYDDETVFELATILYEQEAYQKANLYFKQLDTMNPDFEGYEYGYALSLHADNQIEDALKVTQQGIRKNEYDLQLLLLASQLSYENHHKKDSETYLLRAYEIAEDQEEVLLRLTNLYVEQERFDDVLKLETEEIETVLTKWNIAKSFKALDREEEAFNAYQTIKDDLADNPEFLQEYAILLREYGYIEEAKQMIQHYLSIVPDDINMQDFLDQLDE